MGALSQEIGESTDTHLRGNKKLIMRERKTLMYSQGVRCIAYTANYTI